MYSPTLRWLRRTHRLPSRETCRQTLRRVRLCSDACLWKSALRDFRSSSILDFFDRIDPNRTIGRGSAEFRRFWSCQCFPARPVLSVFNP